MPLGMICCVIQIPTEGEERRAQGMVFQTGDEAIPSFSNSSTSCSTGGNGNTIPERQGKVSGNEAIDRTQQMGNLFSDPCNSATLIDNGSSQSTSDEQTLKPSHSQKISSGDGHKVRDSSSRHRRSIKLEADRNAALERVLREIIFKLNIKNVFWTKDIGEQMLQARFSIYMDEKYERLIATLHEWGIGERDGTSVSLMNCLDSKISAYHYEVHESHSLESGWDRFTDSVRCRLNVNQVVRQVRHDAIITIDFLVLLIAASILACIGLVDNSILFLFSSMLISPLMGPIIAGIFGTVIKDSKLVWLGLKNELLGTTCGTVVGLIFGLIIYCWGHVFIISDGLTQEILSRCEIHSLFIGVFTALASGAAGAIGVLGGNTGSLIGVAISASLLPPAVNSGLLWALALCFYFFEPKHTILGNLIKVKYYSNDPCLELMIYALISMSLTILNIICVWFMGVLVLRFKEIAPSLNTPNQKFWKHDVKVARSANYDTDTQKAINDYEANQNENENLMSLNDSQYHQTWSPSNNLKEYEISCQRSNYHTVQGFEKLCQALRRKKNPAQSITESSTQSMNVMQLFEQGPIIRTPSNTYNNSEPGKKLNQKADMTTKATITPIDSNEQLVKKEILVKTENGEMSKFTQRRVNFRVTASDVCLVNERRGHDNANLLKAPVVNQINMIEPPAGCNLQPPQPNSSNTVDTNIDESDVSVNFEFHVDTNEESSSPSKSEIFYSGDEFDA